MRLLRRKPRQKRTELHGLCNTSNRKLLWLCCLLVAILFVTQSLISFIPVTSRFNPSEIWKKNGIKLTTSTKLVFPSTGVEANWGLTTAAQDWRNYDANRTIAFVHIGKAGGLTVKNSTSCRPKSPKQAETCLKNRFNSNLILPRQVKYYLHMHLYQPNQLAEATSFLVVLRHPVDRLISSYRYSHPDNCCKSLRGRPFQPGGCALEKMSKNPGRPAYEIYSRCWPSPGMEDFAQAVLSPYPTEFNASHLANETLQYQKESPKLCRRIAHRMARGLGPSDPNLHMYYNYEYYMNRTVLEYPDKEVLGIRMEHVWKDLQDLDVALGGAGVFNMKGSAISHGSNSYFPSPVSTAAYQKLCCVLEREIAHYLELLFKVKNLNDAAKQEGWEKVRTSCGIGSQSLDEWRTQCQARIEQDRPLWD
ncbi:expressed unknown protein [Seminavis robusta]|uniref:Sulfotransferase n=1 Tax=Seminavis robusta TaxID=568900 RepID=A0A9N8DZU6_9STRA|nr:expressed unknown protein [Seminavis robusta]|eukprot:Sro507_g156540.1 n/a (420) ;mRNA; f:36294-37553